MFYPAELRNLQAPVSSGKFKLKGMIHNPQAFILMYIDNTKSIIFSRMFFIENGEQSVLCDTATKKATNIENVTTKEYFQDYKTAFIEIKNENLAIKKYSDSILAKNNGKIPTEIEAMLAKKRNDLYKSSDQITLEYVKKHPDSYAAFWSLVEVMPWGYEPIYDSTYAGFSNKIKSTYAGKMLANKLRGGNKMRIGLPFPAINVKPFEKTAERKFNFRTDANYTLVDFWYSHCGPCIAQFPKIKDVYRKYHESDFDIIGISVDRKGDEKDWKTAIIKYGLSWKQYWDINGKESSSLAIGAFPSNFLLDKTGNIIAKNIEPEQLEKFLADKIKQPK